MSSLKKLHTFKLAVDKDEPAFAFDMLDVFMRCYQLLERIRIHATTRAPHDYASNLSSTGVIQEIMRDLPGLRRHHASIYRFTVSILRKAIEKEGSIVLR